MAGLKPIFELNGDIIDPPVNWQELDVLIRFDGDSVEASTQVENFTFVRDAADKIRQWIEDGKNGTGPGVFEGIPFKFTLTDGTTSLPVIDGYVDLVNNFKKNFPLNYTGKIGRADALSDLNSVLQGVTWGLLKAKGKVVNSHYVDIRYLVEPEDNRAELMLMEVSIFLIFRELYQLGKELAIEVGEVVALVTGVVTAVGAIIMAILMITMNIIFLLKLLDILVNLIEAFIAQVYPTAKIVKGMALTTALTIIFSYAGYTFSTPIPEMSKVVLLPSKPEGSETGSLRKNDGIPNPGDYCYRAGETVDLCKRMFNANLRIDESTKTIELLSMNDPKWQQATSYKAADVLDETEVLNAEELTASRILSFTVDPSDFYTRENWKGTTYEVQTVLLNAINAQNSLVKGLKDEPFPVALGNRKSVLTGIERRLKELAEFADQQGPGFSLALKAASQSMASQGPGFAVGSFGQDLQRIKKGTTLAALIQERTNMLKVGSQYWNIPKVVYQDGGAIPADHRDHLSAKALWDNYHSYESFVDNNFGGQRVVVTDQKMPFTFSDFLIAKNNKYFQLADGRQAEFTMIKWAFNMDYAYISYRVKQVFCRSLEEVKIEAA